MRQFLQNDGVAKGKKLACLGADDTATNKIISMKTLNGKISPRLPLPKGGIIPLFGKEGLGEIFQL
jgi:hypothetical protein